ncbi:unnamed protein product [Caretta caretta]
MTLSGASPGTLISLERLILWGLYPILLNTVLTVLHISCRECWLVTALPGGTTLPVVPRARLGTAPAQWGRRRRYKVVVRLRGPLSGEAAAAGQKPGEIFLR